LATRPFKEHSDRFLQKVEILIGKRIRPIEVPAQYSRNLNTLVTHIADYIEQQNGNIENLRDIESVPDEVSWKRQLQTLRSDYTGLHNLQSQLQDEENAIYRIERKSHLIALTFRFLTTVVIGLGVMIIYWVAGELEIAMPLMRIGM